ncbi:hypothetical protein CYMTET_20738 [Cymbomonas tetramitiformis]|uniref:Uncharacterized protein n=1 Tax=Cymbomonas tetramitiformis TaxID=36881 RepID=A0AAE0G3P9_9CHLO|nr:hypothetical protein CYMTET_20738 [Cymbomonas tetramitiformis]
MVAPNLNEILCKPEAEEEYLTKLSAKEAKRLEVHKRKKEVELGGVAKMSASWHSISAEHQASRDKFTSMQLAGQRAATLGTQEIAAFLENLKDKHEYELQQLRETMEQQNLRQEQHLAEYKSLVQQHMAEKKAYREELHLKAQKVMAEERAKREEHYEAYFERTKEIESQLAEFHKIEQEQLVEREKAKGIKSAKVKEAWGKRSTQSQVSVEKRHKAKWGTAEQRLEAQRVARQQELELRKKRKAEEMQRVNQRLWNKINQEEERKEEVQRKLQQQVEHAETLKEEQTAFRDKLQQCNKEMVQYVQDSKRVLDTQRVQQQEFLKKKQEHEMKVFDMKEKRKQLMINYLRRCSNVGSQAKADTMNAFQTRCIKGSDKTLGKLPDVKIALPKFPKTPAQPAMPSPSPVTSAIRPRRPAMPMRDYKSEFSTRSFTLLSCAS